MARLLRLLFILLVQSLRSRHHLLLEVLALRQQNAARTAMNGLVGEAMEYDLDGAPSGVHQPRRHQWRGGSRAGGLDGTTSYWAPRQLQLSMRFIF
jgi:hypothetical protein